MGKPEDEEICPACGSGVPVKEHHAVSFKGAVLVLPDGREVSGTWQIHGEAAKEIHKAMLRNNARAVADRYDSFLHVLKQDILLCFGNDGNPAASWPSIRDRLDELSADVVKRNVRTALFALSQIPVSPGKTRPGTALLHDYLKSRGIQLFETLNIRSPNLQQVPRSPK